MNPRCWIVAAGAWTAGCGTPGLPTDPIPLQSAVHLFGVLDPDTTTQLVVVTAVGPTKLPDPEGDLLAIGADGTSRLAARSRLEQTSCLAAFARIFGSASCLAFDTAIETDGRYRVLIRAGTHVASATVDVPGRFGIDRASAANGGAGATVIGASWSRSSAAFRYLVAVRMLVPFDPRLPPSVGDAWSTVTDQLAVDTTLSANELQGGPNRDLDLTVFAMSRPLAEYLASQPGGLYPVPPRQNVVGGYGAVGAWVRRTTVLPYQAGAAGIGLTK